MLDASEGGEDYGAQNRSCLSSQIINSSHVPQKMLTVRASLASVSNPSPHARGETIADFFSVLSSPSPSPCVPKELLPDQDTAMYEQTLHVSTPDRCLLVSSIPCLPQRVNTQPLENVFVLYI